MKKVSARSSARGKSLAPWVWVLIGVAGVAILLGGGYAVYRGIARPAPALPSASDALPTLPRPQLPGGNALPEGPLSAELPPGAPLPQADYPGAQLPEGPALPEAEARPQPERPEGPSGNVYYAAEVFPVRSRTLEALGLGPRHGMQFVSAMYWILNLSTIPVGVDHNFCAIEFNGLTYFPHVLPSAGDALEGRPFLTPVTVQPQGETAGYVAFEIPAGAAGVEPRFNLQGLPPGVRVQRVTKEQMATLKAQAAQAAGR